MSRRLGILILVTVLLGLGGSLFAINEPGDAEGSKDPSLFTRMPGHFISSYEEKEFDRFEFPVNRDYSTQAVEGRHLWITYMPNEGIKQPSGLQIIHNYTNAALAIGGKKVVEFEDGSVEHVTLKITKGNAEI